MPDLAESWEVLDGGKKIVFNLRRGVRFHDGTEFNADAVVFSFKRQMDKDHPYHFGEYIYWNAMYRGIKDVKKIDDFTIAIHIDEPFSPLIQNMAMFPVSIVSPEAVKKYGRDFSKNPVGTGPFIFSHWEEGKRIVLEANPDYFEGRPYLDRLVFMTVKDQHTRRIQLEGGIVHVSFDMPPEQLSFFKMNPNLKTYSISGMNVFYLAMNVQKPPFDNKLVRMALNHAINREAIVRLVYQGSATVARGVLPPTIWGYEKDLRHYHYDPGAARRMLESAGYAEGFKCELHTMDVPRPYIPDPIKASRMIKKDLSKIGISVQIVISSWEQYIKLIQDGEHQMCLSGWISDNGDPDNFLYVLLDKDNALRGTAQNVAFFRNEELHRMLIEARRLLDRRQREVIYRNAQRLINEEVPWVPIAHSEFNVVANRSVKGILLNPTGIIYFRGVWFERLNPLIR
jgi:peptide/nickel transport system substrate-binding protein